MGFITLSESKINELINLFKLGYPNHIIREKLDIGEHLLVRYYKDLNLSESSRLPKEQREYKKPRKVNKYTENGNITEIEVLHKGQKIQSIIDTEDKDKVSAYYWGAVCHNRNRDEHGIYIKCANPAVAKEFTKNPNFKGGLLLHQFIIGKKEGYLIDHINGNQLDNRKSNLRHVNKQQNSFNSRRRKSNTSGHIGVHFNKNKKKWQAYIQLNKKTIVFGYFDDINDAVRARKEGELKYFGEYAPR